MKPASAALGFIIGLSVPGYLTTAATGWDRYRLGIIAIVAIIGVLGHFWQLSKAGAR